MKLDQPVAAFLLTFALGIPSLAGPLLGQGLAGDWEPMGPAPATDGQVENVGVDDQIVGAIHAIATHPSDPDILYVGGTNAGVWKTTDATAASPHWSQLTDGEQSMSIGALEFDPTDGTFQTLVAGIGRFSSFGRRGGSRIGLLRTSDGGASWTPLDGGLAGKNISGVAARGSTLVVSVNSADVNSLANLGIWRSTNGGTTFTQVSAAGGAGSGIARGVNFDLAGDPTSNSTLYTSVSSANEDGGTNGIYKSTDTGATWTKVSDATMDSQMSDTLTFTNAEIAVGQSGEIYVAICVSGRLSGVFRSGNGGTSWTSLGVPTTIEDGFPIGIHPGGQASIHLSIAADPSNANLVYLGGDRQPYFSEASGGGTFFPNSLGALDYSGRLFRGDAAAEGSTWTPLTHTGTANSSSPHADSRELKVDAAGTLIESDDGGIYKRTSPQSSVGDWLSLIGDLQSTEYHGLAYDAVSDIVIGGAQDTGTTEQVVPNMPTFFSVLTADGGDTAVDSISTPGFSTRFQSFQFLSAFRRRVYDASNTFQSVQGISLTVLGGGAAVAPQFYSPIAINEIDGDRLLIGASNSVYESMDQGDTVTEILPLVTVNSSAGDPILYGVPGNADMLHIASGADVYRRTAAHPSPLVAVTQPNGLFIRDISIDPDNPSRLFAVSSADVRFSDNAGTSWSQITDNLAALGASDFRTLEFVPGADDALVLGTGQGIFVAYESTGFDWEALGSPPNAPVFELIYDETDDVLVAAILGRGAWRLGVGLIFSDGFESGDTSAWSATVP